MMMMYQLTMIVVCMHWMMQITDRNLFPKMKNSTHEAQSSFTCPSVTSGFFIFLFFIFVFYKNIFSIWKFTGIYPGRPAARRPGPGRPVAKMAPHAIFQYNILAIDDTHNTWTNMIVKINIPRLLGSSDDKEKIGAARPEGPPLRGFRYPVSGRGSRGSRPSRVSRQRPESSSVQGTRIEAFCYHRLNRRRAK